jgi:hypothetical protein
MPVRSLPVRPDLTQLKHQAKDLLKAFRRGDATAAAAFSEFHPALVSLGDAKLADAQLVLARSYGASSWTRLVQCCDLIDAIWNDELDAVRRLVTANPQLIHDQTRMVRDNWGPPMSYAANLGRDQIIQLLHSLGATDLQFALGRAVLQSRVGTASMLHDMLGRPAPPAGALDGAAYTLSVPVTEFVFRLGLRIEPGMRPPVGTVIETDSRRPAGKRRILALYAEHGYVFPDTPIMAFHRGRFDLLGEHLKRDPGLLARRFSIEEIFPRDVGCQSQSYEAMGTPVDGGTLLHLAVYWDELDMAERLLERGADANARAAVDPDGVGGFTPLFNCVVSQAGFWLNYSRGGSAQPSDAAITELLLARGADPNVRASIRMRLGEGHSDTRLRDFRDVTALSWAARFSDQQQAGKHRESLFVNGAAVRAIEAHGARE